MARVTQQKSSRQNGNSNSNSVRGAQVSKQRNNKKQKVVIKGNQQGQNGSSDVVSVSHKTVRGRRTAERHAYGRQLSFHTEPPPGYTFIPAGNPQLTTALKEFAQRGNHKIYSVSVSGLNLDLTPLLSNHHRLRLMPLAMSYRVKSIVSVFTFPRLLWHRYATIMASV